MTISELLTLSVTIGFILSGIFIFGFLFGKGESKESEESEEKFDSEYYTSEELDVRKAKAREIWETKKGDKENE